MKKPTLFILLWNATPKTSELAPPPLFFNEHNNQLSQGFPFPATPKHTLSLIYLSSPFIFFPLFMPFSAMVCYTITREGSLPMDCVPLLLQSNWQTGTEFPL